MCLCSRRDRSALSCCICCEGEGSAAALSRCIRCFKRLLACCKKGQAPPSASCQCQAVPCQCFQVARPAGQAARFGCVSVLRVLCCIEQCLKRQLESYTCIRACLPCWWCRSEKRGPIFHWFSHGQLDSKAVLRKRGMRGRP